MHFKKWIAKLGKLFARVIFVALNLSLLHFCFFLFWLLIGLKTVLPTMASGDDSPIFEDDESPPYSLEKMTDLVAVWEVALSDGVHKIEFEHGTTSGKRVVYVNGKEVIRKEWMFKLVGKETFCVGTAKTKATINIDAVSGFAYEYTLEINGKSLKKYMENRSKTTNTWVLHLDNEDFRVVLEKDTMDVWCNGKKMETAGEFVDDGTETHFNIGNHDCYIKAVSSGKRKEGIIHSLIVDNREIPEILE
ncbi:fas apoptotic inhibitory molecule 1 isoform X2 [Moschus berezovskii]|uniref:fas apoptotic inhibitory molecule 1 isoform X2 n=2 Tax=Moschus berezovskii TaxID=68408 RepID=UPI002443EB53|nr:fas apoptotic inhibitory molecule 1 isoform X2 [Moschus berezovskii]